MIIRIFCSGILILLFSFQIYSQDLNVYETIAYINNKLEDYPCNHTSGGYAKLKIGVTSDGYLTLREITYSEYQLDREFGNNLSKARISSLNFDRIELKKYNSRNSFIEIPCKGEVSYKPGNCIMAKNLTSSRINYWNTFKVCFTADYDTQKSLLNAFKHLGSLLNSDPGFHPSSNDPFANYENKKQQPNQNNFSKSSVSTIDKTNITDKKNSETVYSLNAGVTTNNVKKGSPIIWGNTKLFTNGSYIKIKNKTNGNYYIQTVVGGQFAYGHYFKYKAKEANKYKYIRTDGDDKEFLLVNYPLSKLAESNQYDEKVRLELINYRTSFAMLLLF